MHWIHTVLCYAITCVSGEWFYVQDDMTETDKIIARLSHVSLTSCQLKCSNNRDCVSIALPTVPLLGEIGDCYLLKNGWDVPNGSNEELMMLYVVNIKLSPLGCKENIAPIVNDECDPPAEPIEAVPTNLALEKPVTVIKMAPSPALLVDGDVDAFFFTRPGEDNPWVRIDLEEEAVITKVHLYEGIHRFTHLTDSVVSVGMTTHPSSACGTATDDKKITDTSRGGKIYFEVVCLTRLDGRYVKVQRMARGAMISSNEVEVYGVFKT